ncbi:MAG: hypothetical protein OK457_00540 [Thaumarchaeota archaeon]|nr:hypothetical protein [Nitrososphaerota archaeon]
MDRTTGEKMKSVRSFTEKEAIWLACAIDGEGSIGLYHGQEGRFTLIQMGNTNKNFVREMKRIIGCGSQIHRTKFKYPHMGRKPIYHYTLKGSIRCERVLKQIVKYLIIKKQKALIILHELKIKPFGEWTNKRRKAASKSLRIQWRNPKIRASRLKGMRRCQ